MPCTSNSFLRNMAAVLTSFGLVHESVSQSVLNLSKKRKFLWENPTKPQHHILGRVLVEFGEMACPSQPLVSGQSTLLHWILSQVPSGQHCTLPGAVTALPPAIPGSSCLTVNSFITASLRPGKTWPLVVTHSGRAAERRAGLWNWAPPGSKSGLAWFPQPLWSSASPCVTQGITMTMTSRVWRVELGHRRHPGWLCSMVGAQMSCRCGSSLLLLFKTISQK